MTLSWEADRLVVGLVSLLRLALLKDIFRWKITVALPPSGAT